MNINKYLNKLNIKYTFQDNIFTFTLDNGEIKKILKKDLEQYLFIQMIEYIKES